MDSVVGEDQTLPIDMNGSNNMSRLRDTDIGHFAVDNMPASMFPGRMSPAKALTMKDYENQIAGLKKENFSLKLRIYFMEERAEQKFDDSTEDIYKTNIELKVEVESLKRDLAEKQELLVSASKAVENLAGKESAEIIRLKDRAKREMEQLKDVFNRRIQQLEESVKMAEEDSEKMAAIAEQEKVRNLELEKQLLAFGDSSTFTPAPSQDVHHVLQEKDSVIEQLRHSLKNREAEVEQLRKASIEQSEGEQPSSDHVRHLSAVIAEKDKELETIREQLEHKRLRHEEDVQNFVDTRSEMARLETLTKQLTEELDSTKTNIQNLQKALEDGESENKTLRGKLEEKENELASEKKNALKRDKTIQGLSLVLKEKDKEIEELCHEIDDRDEALAKAREATHKAQIQKYQGAEEHQNLLMEKQTELEALQLEHHGKVLESQKLQRALRLRNQELGDMQQAKEQLEQELDELRQQKKKGDKAVNDLQNKLKKLNGQMEERENALAQQYQTALDKSERKLHDHEVTIQRLTCNLAEKERQLQEYMNMINEQEQRSPGGTDAMLAKLRERLKEKENALEQAIDEKFAALEEKDNDIRQLQLLLRERERDLERLKNLLAHNEETINSFDALIKEKDVELQHLANSFKNQQRAKQEMEENLSRSLREKDALISQLQMALDGKSKDLEEMANTLLSKVQTGDGDLAKQLSQRLKVVEVMLSEVMKDRERLVADNESAVEGLLNTISSKDQLLKESVERYNRTLAERSQEIQDLKRQLSEKREQLSNVEKQSKMTTQEKHLETTELRVLLTEKDSIINKLVESGQERERFLTELKLMEISVPQVLELKQTIQVLQEQLEEKEAELSKISEELDMEKVPGKKSIAVLKKELAQKSEVLKKALKKENDLRAELAELRSVLVDVEGRNEAHAANIESMSAMLEKKDQIIWSLREHLGKPGYHDLCDPRVLAAESKAERPLPSIPQRERTIIGGNSQQEDIPTLSMLLSEHEALNQALKAEQQIYSNLVRTVKEQDSAQRLHALHMELAAVQLLREQLEEGVQNNEDLQRELEREIRGAKQREGNETEAKQAYPKELESMQHQLEEAQRWNASLQARLGAIQSRGGGVGGTSDTADTFSLLADQTSYMSICMEDRLDEELAHLSVAELHRMIFELKDYIKQLQALNDDQQKASLVKTTDSDERKSRDVWKHVSENEHLEKRHEEAGCINKIPHPVLSKEILKAASEQPRNECTKSSDDSRSEESSERTNESEGEGSREKRVKTDERDRSQDNGEGELLVSLLKERGMSSVTQLREEILRLQAENVDLKGLLKEEKSVESKESSESSGESDSSKDLQKVVDKLKSEAKTYRKVIKLLKHQLELNSASEGDASFNPDLIVSMAREIEWLKGEQVSSRARAEDLEKKLLEKNAQKHKASLQRLISTEEVGLNPAQHKTPILAGRSRIPVPIRYGKAVIDSRAGMRWASDTLLLSQEEVLQIEKKQLNQLSPVGSDQEECSQLSPGCQRSPVAEQESGSSKAMQITDSELLGQLELLHAECLEKEQIIAQLQEKVSICEDLQMKLIDKEELNREFVEALQAAESTIEYLTACNLDNQENYNTVPDSDLRRQCSELQKALQEKENLNKQLMDCLQAAESAIDSLNGLASDPLDEDSQKFSTDPKELLHKLQSALQKISMTTDQAPLCQEKAGASDPLGMETDLHRQIDQLQEALWEQSRKNAELQERLLAAELVTAQQNGTRRATVEDLGVGGHGQNNKDTQAGVEDGQKQELDGRLKTEEVDARHGYAEEKQYTEKLRRDSEKQRLLIRQMSECLCAAESAIASLAAFCSQNKDKEKPLTSADLQQHLEDLQKAEQQKSQWHKLSLESYQQEIGVHDHKGQKTGLCRNISYLQRAFTENGRVMSELQQALEKQKQQNEESEKKLRMARTRAKTADVSSKMEDLEKALREKEHMCEVLEEKLKAAQSVNAKQKPVWESQDGSQKAMPLGKDDKEVQVDLQDLGYETSGRSENEMDREESSSTDHNRDLHRASDPSIPTLLREVRGNFSSSVENLDTNSSTSYPSSPTLSSPKVSLKSLQAYEDYGLSDSPGCLKEQVLELKGQLENQQRVIHHLQGLLRQTSQSGGAQNTDFEPHDQHLAEEVKYKNSIEQNFSSDDEEKQAMKDQITNLNTELEKERNVNKNLAEQLQQVQFRSRSASPARIESLVQSQARELSQLRQQIKESRTLGALQRQQLVDLGKAVEELLQDSDFDRFAGELFREQLDKSLTVLERLEEQLENGDKHLDNEDSAALELAQRESLCLPLDTADSLHNDLKYLRSQLEGEREQLQQQIRYLVQQNQNLAEVTKEQLDLLSRELQEKNRLVLRLQRQLRGCSPSSQHSSVSDLSDRASSSTSPASDHTQNHAQVAGGRSGPSSGVSVDAVSHLPDIAELGSPAGSEKDTHLHSLQRENGRLMEQLRTSEQLNDTLRSELDLHRSILAEKEGTPPHPSSSARAAGPDTAQGLAPAMSPELLAEHLLEIRRLRQRLEETIRTNDRLREQLERRLSEVEKNPAATNICIRGNEEQDQLASEVRFLWGQNQALKEQLSMGSRDKQKENEKLRESLARRTAKMEYLKNELETLRRERSSLQSRLMGAEADNRELQESMRSSRDEVLRLHSEVKVLRQQLTDSQRLLQSLRVELQVWEQMKSTPEERAGPTPEGAACGSGTVDLCELLSEIRHLRLQLERSIRTNNALRHKLEERLTDGAGQAEGTPSTININYLLSTEPRASPQSSAAADGLKSSGRDGTDPLLHPSQVSTHERTSSDVLHEVYDALKAEPDSQSQCSGSSADSASLKATRLVPGHRLWANKNGRHVLGLIEDHNALRKQISEGRKLVRETHSNLRTFIQEGSESSVLDQQHLKEFSKSMNTMQQVLDEAARLLKLVWRVSLPTCTSVDGCQGHQDEILKSEIVRLKSKLSQQERMLSGVVKRLRTTNQMKEGMERVIIEQLSLTHDVLKKARGNLEEVPANG